MQLLRPAIISVSHNAKAFTKKSNCKGTSISSVWGAGNRSEETGETPLSWRPSSPPEERLVNGVL